MSSECILISAGIRCKSDVCKKWHFNSDLVFWTVSLNIVCFFLFFFRKNRNSHWIIIIKYWYHIISLHLVSVGLTILTSIHSFTLLYQRRNGIHWKLLVQSRHSERLLSAHLQCGVGQSKSTHRHITCNRCFLFLLVVCSRGQWKETETHG